MKLGEIRCPKVVIKEEIRNHPLVMDYLEGVGLGREEEWLLSKIFEVVELDLFPQVAGGFPDELCANEDNPHLALIHALGTDEVLEVPLWWLRPVFGKRE